MHFCSDVRSYAWRTGSPACGAVLVAVIALDFVGGLLIQLAAGINNPRALPILLLSWAFKIVELALIVRVLSSWLPISPYSRWIRWTYPLSNCILLEPTALRLVGAVVGA